jgi:glyoxylase-like metal-dependent hydrolase (beta-lactamase superfamily II)
MLEVVPQVYQLGRRGFGLPGANVFLLAGEKLTLVDAGFRGQEHPILNEVAGTGHSPSDIIEIVLTHYHPDHIGSLPALQKLTGAKVAAHHIEAQYLSGQAVPQTPETQGFLGSLLKTLRSSLKSAPVVIDILLNDGDELPILGGVKILHTPGHTPGSICLYVKTKKLVIVGDLLRNTSGLSLPPRIFTESPELELSSIKKISELDFDTICFGHGMPVVGNAKQILLEFMGKIEKKAKATANKS